MHGTCICSDSHAPHWLISGLLASVLSIIDGNQEAVGGWCRQLPESVMQMVLEQLGKVLANDAAGRAQFVHTGGLAAVQLMGEAPGSSLKEVVEIINASYPEEIVKYYSPGYSQQLLEKLDKLAAAGQTTMVA